MTDMTDMENRPYYKKNKYSHCSHDYDTDTTTDTNTDTNNDTNNELCPTDPDLILLRKNAIGERKAIAFYLRAASRTSGALSELFTDTAHDEMIHFRNTMTLLAKYDPMQAQAFEDADIDLPVLTFRKSPACSQEKLETIDLLTQAIADELEAINMYQKSYEAACHEDVKALFCHNANDEKVHVAEFWKALMAYTKENTL